MPDTSVTSATICANQLPYNWNGNTYNSSGNYSVTLISAGGCDSVCTLALVVYPVTTSNTNITICNTQLPYNWNGNNYSAGGIYNITLVNANGCDSLAALNLSVTLTATSSTTVTLCNDQLPYNWNGNNYVTAGTYSVLLTGSSGCDSIASLVLQVKQPSSSTTNISACINQLPFTWNGQQFSTSGSHIVHLTNTAGCDSVATLNLTVSPVLSSTTNASTCTNHLPFSWNGNNYSTPGLHTVTLTTSAGCDSLATLDLVINNVATSYTIINTCFNQLPFNWNGQAYSASGSYSVTLASSAGCDSVATLQLTVHPIRNSYNKHVRLLCRITICLEWPKLY